MDFAVWSGGQRRPVQVLKGTLLSFDPTRIRWENLRNCSSALKPYGGKSSHATGIISLVKPLKHKQKPPLWWGGGQGGRRRVAHILTQHQLCLVKTSVFLLVLHLLVGVITEPFLTSHCGSPLRSPEVSTGCSPEPLRNRVQSRLDLLKPKVTWAPGSKIPESKPSLSSN